MKRISSPTNKPTAFRVAAAAFEKAKQHRAALATFWDDLLSLVRLVKAWARGEYTGIPWRSIVVAVGALVYFVNPLDAIPDALPGLGYIDDGAVLAFVVGAIKVDLERFTRWEQTREWRHAPRPARRLVESRPRP